jgi:hypothetical protein
LSRTGSAPTAMQLFRWPSRSMTIMCASFFVIRVFFLQNIPLSNSRDAVVCSPRVASMQVFVSRFLPPSGICVFALRVRPNASLDLILQLPPPLPYSSFVVARLAITGPTESFGRSSCQLRCRGRSAPAVAVRVAPGGLVPASGLCRWERRGRSAPANEACASGICQWWQCDVACLSVSVQHLRRRLRGCRPCPGPQQPRIDSSADGHGALPATVPSSASVKPQPLWVFFQGLSVLQFLVLFWLTEPIAGWCWFTFFLQLCV